VDYEKIAAAALQAMAAADLHRFLVVCALVSNLYCPSYDPSQLLAKDSNLARTAVRYKVDSAKIVRALREELSQSRDKVRDQTKLIKKLGPTTAQRPRAKSFNRSM